MRALNWALYGAALAFVAAALFGAVFFEIGALTNPNSDSRPADAWVAGAIFFGLGLGPRAALAAATVGFIAGWVSDAARAAKGKG